MHRIVHGSVEHVVEVWKSERDIRKDIPWNVVIFGALQYLERFKLEQTPQRNDFAKLAFPWIIEYLAQESSLAMQHTILAMIAGDSERTSSLLTDTYFYMRNVILSVQKMEVVKEYMHKAEEEDSEI